MLEEFAPLSRKPEFLLREELRDVAPFHAVLMAIANGAHTPKAIAAASGVPGRKLHYTFEQLVALGYVSRRYPLTGLKPRRTDVRFVLDDALLRFWFRLRRRACSSACAPTASPSSASASGDLWPALR